MVPGSCAATSPLAGEERDLARNEPSRSGEGVSKVEFLPADDSTEQFDEALLVRAKWMRANPTDAEHKFWSMLRNKRFIGYKFKRQQIIAPYIVDFVCFGARLIVEADGSQHADNRYHQQRDGFLTAQGFNILRFWNNEILGGVAGIGDAIYAMLQSPPLPPTVARWAPPSPARGEGSSH
jgi:very-short-patch-repair endonuclease